MTSGAGGQGARPAPRYRGSLVGVAAAVLLLGGGGAIARGLLTQQTPPSPVQAATPTYARIPFAVADAMAGDASPSDTRPPSTSATTATTTPTTATTATTTPAKKRPSRLPAFAPAARPVHLRIPAIGVDTELVVLGLTPDGALAVPPAGPDYDKAAWFDGSPAPGDAGPAVIEGHVDSAAEGPSVFFKLAGLIPGDQILVDRADGSTVSFTVDAVGSYPKDDFPTLHVYGNTSGPELRLITCGGDFDSAAGSYRDNTVAYAGLTP